MRTIVILVALASIAIACGTHRNLTAKQARSIADSAAVAAGYTHDAWIQQFVIYNPTSRVWSVSYCNYPPQRAYTGFGVTVQDETRETAIHPAYE